MQQEKERIIEITNRLLPKLNRLSEFDDFDDRIPKAHPPASPNSIFAYEKYLGVKLPVSYRAFLELYNGFDAMAFPGDMLAIQDVMPGGKCYELIKEWKTRSAEFGAGEVLDGIVIAHLGEPNSWVYLDPNQPTGEGEFTVVRWSPHVSLKWKDLIEYLEERVSQCKISIDEMLKEESSDS